jgi:hypothetical protein
MDRILLARMLIGRGGGQGIVDTGEAKLKGRVRLSLILAEPLEPRESAREALNRSSLTWSFLKL